MEVNDLYDAYKFEMEECGYTKTSERVLVDHIIKYIKLFGKQGLRSLESQL
jgi:hypothetical protein